LIPDLPPDLIPDLPPDLPLNLPLNLPPDLPLNLLPDLPPDLPLDLPPDLLTDLPPYLVIHSSAPISYCTYNNCLLQYVKQNRLTRTLSMLLYGHETRSFPPNITMS